MGLGRKLRDARKKKGLSQSEVAAGTRMKVQIVNSLEEEDFSRVAAPIYGKGFIKMFAEYVGIDPGPLIDEYMSRFVNPAPPPPPVTMDETVARAPAEQISEQQYALESPGEQEQEAGNEQETEPDLFSQRFTQRTSSPAPKENVQPEKKPLINIDQIKVYASKFYLNLKQGTEYITKKMSYAFLKLSCFIKSRNWSVLRPTFPHTPVKTISVVAVVVFVIVLLVSMLHSCISRPQESRNQTLNPEPVRELQPALELPAPFIDQ